MIDTESFVAMVLLALQQILSQKLFANISINVCYQEIPETQVIKEVIDLPAVVIKTNKNKNPSQTSSKNPFKRSLEIEYEFIMSVGANFQRNPKTRKVVRSVEFATDRRV